MNHIRYNVNVIHKKEEVSKMYMLKELREKANLTQESLAKLINVDRSTIAKWETGEASPRSDKLPTLANVLNCTIDDLF